MLCNPDSSFNVGAVCRAMKTMGFGRLTVAGRLLNYDLEKIRFMSVHALDVFESAEHTETLEEALADCALSAGVTRRHGKRRKLSSFLPEEFAARILAVPSGTVALVFGNEEHGLTTEELALCDAAVHIPASEEFPSLNLSHAVQVVTYTLRRCFLASRYGRKESITAPDERPIDRGKIDALADTAIDSLRAIGFFRISDSAPTRVFLRDVMARAALNADEISEMENIFRKIRHIRPGKNG